MKETFLVLLFFVSRAIKFQFGETIMKGRSHLCVCGGCCVCYWRLVQVCVDDPML